MATLAALAATAAPAPAAAAQLTVYGGRLPDGTAVSGGPWRAALDGPGINVGSLDGGRFGVHLPAGAGNRYTNEARLAPPPHTSWAAARADVEFAGIGAPHAAEAYWQSTWEPPPNSIGVRLGIDRPAFDVTGTWRHASWADPVGDLSIQISCAANPGYNCPSTDASYWINGATYVLHDTTKPTASVRHDGGPLLDEGWKTSAATSLSITAADLGVGVYRLILRHDDSTWRVPVDPGDAACRDATPGSGSEYEFAARRSTLVPCPTAGRDYSVPVDLHELGLGDGTVTGVDVAIEDAAGNETTIADDRTLRINLPGGVLSDPGTPCANGTHDASGTCVARPPSSTRPPLLSGLPVEGGILSTDTGGWADVVGATYVYRWERCDAAGAACGTIAGAHTPALRLTRDDAGGTIRSVVAATTSGGTTEARSAPSPIVDDDGHGTGLGGSGGTRDVQRRPAGAAPGDDAGEGSTVVDADAGRLPAPSSAGGATGAGPNGQGDDGRAVALTATLAGGARPRPYGARMTVIGRLLSGPGTPIANAQVDVLSVVAVKGAKPAIAGATTTDADGHFRYDVPTGASRTLIFGYRRSLADQAYAETASVTVAVRAGVTFAASTRAARNGEAIVLHGAIAAAADGPRPLVDLQVVKAGRWVTFARSRSSGGAFRYRYRFTRTRTTTSYRLRVRVQATEGWPVLPSASNEVTVKVAGR